MDYSLPGSSVYGISQQEYWNGLSFPWGKYSDIKRLCINYLCGVVSLRELLLMNFLGVDFRRGHFKC